MGNFLLGAWVMGVVVFICGLCCLSAEEQDDRHALAQLNSHCRSLEVLDYNGENYELFRCRYGSQLIKLHN